MLLTTMKYCPRREDRRNAVFGQGSPQILSLYTVPGVFDNKMNTICPTPKEQKMDKQRDMSDQQTSQPKVILIFRVLRRVAWLPEV